MTRLRLALLASAALLTCGAGTAFAGYGDDRALIEDLQARYLFAFDFGDAENYAGTFAEDGILNYGGGEIKGRKAIASFIADGSKRQAEARAKLQPGEHLLNGRHIISNIVIRIDSSGNQARAMAYWTHMTSTATGRGTVDFWGHYEDELVKVNGQWLFARRHIYNEAIPEWNAGTNNPVITPSPPPKVRPPSNPQNAAPAPARAN